MRASNIAFALVALLAAGCTDKGLAGIPTVIDGDTIVIGDARIRLEGIDAPEMDQVCLTAEGQCWKCGEAAKRAMAEMVEGKTISCPAAGQDRYGRTLSRCTIGPLEINARMVEEGWALSFVRYGDRYRAEEERAQAARGGLWAGAFIAPWDWRHRSEDTTVHGAEAVPLKGRASLLRGQPTEACP